MELHLDAAILVAEDFLAGRSDYRSGLDSGDHRFGRHALRTVRQRDGNTTEAVLIMERGRLFAAVIAAEVGVVFDARQKVLAVGVEMPLQRELVPRNELAAITRSSDLQAGGLLPLHAQPHGSFFIPENFL